MNLRTRTSLELFALTARICEEDLSSSQQLSFRNHFYDSLKTYFFLQSGLKTDPKTLCQDLSFVALLDNLCFLIPLDSDKKIKLLRSLKPRKDVFSFKIFLRWRSINSVVWRKKMRLIKGMDLVHFTPVVIVMGAQ